MAKGTYNQNRTDAKGINSPQPKDRPKATPSRWLEIGRLMEELPEQAFVMRHADEWSVRKSCTSPRCASEDLLTALRAFKGETNGR